MATTTDLISASRELDPASRALLNLWLHRGLDDAAIAHLSGGSVEEVAERRRRLVERLAEAVQSPPDEVRATLDGMSGGQRARTSVSQAEVEVDGPPAPVAPVPLGALTAPPTDSAAELELPGEPQVAPAEPVPEPVVAGEPGRSSDLGMILPATAGVEAEDDRREAPGLEVPESPSPAARRAAERGRRRESTAGTAGAEAHRSSPFPAALGFTLGAVIVIMVAVAALTGGSGGGGGRSAASATPAPTATATPTATRAGTPPSPLETVPGGPSGPRGTVRTEGDRVRLSVRRLERPAADYEVWLFNSVADARSLGRLDRGSFRLPRDRSRFRYLEVSLEPRSERAPAHSGRTVLRTAVPR